MRLVGFHCCPGGGEEEKNFCTYTELNKNHDSSVGIALGYGLNDRRPTQPPIQWVPAAKAAGA